MWWFYWMALRMLGEHPVRLVATESPPHISQLDGLIVGGGDDISFEL